jgi:streptomycin 6-kinase
LKKYYSNFKIPYEIQKNILSYYGKSGKIWCDTAPKIANEILELWNLSIYSSISGSTCSLILLCNTHDSHKVVLKLPYIDNENEFEASALAHYSGQGAVKLIAYEKNSGAMLLEYVISGIPLFNHGDTYEALKILCEKLFELRCLPPVGLHLRTVYDWAQELLLEVTQSKNFHLAIVRTLSTVVGYLMGTTTGEILFMVNRDPHCFNVLSSDREPWLLIDPKPILGESSFEGAQVLLGSINTNDSGKSICNILDIIAPFFGYNSSRILCWAFLRAMHASLWEVKIGNLKYSQIAMTKAIHISLAIRNDLVKI